MFFKDGGRHRFGSRERKKQTFEGQAGRLFSPPMNAWHQHFNQGDIPACYLALRRGSHKHRMAGKQYSTYLEMTQGGDQLEYKDQDPEIHRLFESERARSGVKVTMKIA